MSPKCATEWGPLCLAITRPALVLDPCQMKSDKDNKRSFLMTTVFEFFNFLSTCGKPLYVEGPCLLLRHNFEQWPLLPPTSIPQRRRQGSPGAGHS